MIIIVVVPEHLRDINRNTNDLTYREIEKKNTQERETDVFPFIHLKKQEQVGLLKKKKKRTYSWSVT